MGHKIFISYKYADSNVKNLQGYRFGECIARDYVNELQTYIEEYSEHIFKAEEEGEDLSGFSEEAIWKRLKDRIYDSTLTIVLISAGMRESKKDRDQWIPWEISYSLKEENRKDINGNDKSSGTNALLGIIIPDMWGRYEFFETDKTCCQSGCRSYNTSKLFTILRENMFNIIEPDKNECPDGSTVYHGDSSYMHVVKWVDFIKDPEKYIDKAYNILSKKEQYKIHKEVD